jgi:hypothetical protein
MVVAGYKLEKDGGALRGQLRPGWHSCDYIEMRIEGKTGEKGRRWQEFASRG